MLLTWIWRRLLDSWTEQCCKRQYAVLVIQLHSQFNSWPALMNISQGQEQPVKLLRKYNSYRTRMHPGANSLLQSYGWILGHADQKAGISVGKDLFIDADYADDVALFRTLRTTCLPISIAFNLSQHFWVWRFQGEIPKVQNLVAAKKQSPWLTYSLLPS